MSDIREDVRARYAEVARAVGRHEEDPSLPATCCGSTTEPASSSCCASVPSSSGCYTGTPAGESLGASLYDALEREAIPDTALLASLGCGNPTAVAELRAGESVLDLGSGGGVDVLLSAKRVGPEGKVYGLDMTDEMLTLARENKAKAGVANVDFLAGYIESIPLPAGTIDVIISNCVINLAADKKAVFREMHRVLNQGGRIGVTDIVAADELSREDIARRGSYVGCIAGALTFSEYELGLEDAGFTDVSVTPTHAVSEGMFSAIIKARRT